MSTPITDKVQFRVGDSNHFAVHVVHVRALELAANAMEEALLSVIEALNQTEHIAAYAKACAALAKYRALKP